MDEWLESAVNLTAETGLGIDFETCPACGGAVRIIACIEDAAVSQTILAHLRTTDETCASFPLPESRAPAGTLAG